MDTLVSLCIIAVSGASTGFTIDKEYNREVQYITYVVSVLRVLGGGRFDIGSLLRFCVRVLCTPAPHTERRPGSTRVPVHAFLSRRSS
jgi:hypothetical protein